MLFTDVGTISDAASPWIKLRVTTLERARIAGEARCATVRAAISGPLYFGRKHEGAIVTHIAPADGRLLEPTAMADPTMPSPLTMAPWANVAPVSATIASPFK